MHDFNWLSYLLRWVASILLVLATYNPFGLSYWDWLTNDGGYVSLKVLAGVALLILHIVATVSTTRSLGIIGIGLLTAFYGAVAWLLVDHNLLDLNDPRRRRSFVAFLLLAFVFLFMSAFGSYRAFEHTESVQFCGQTCHTVMQPEFTAYQNSVRSFTDAFDSLRSAKVLP